MENLRPKLYCCAPCGFSFLFFSTLMTIKFHEKSEDKKTFGKRVAPNGAFMKILQYRKLSTLKSKTFLPQYSISSYLIFFFFKYVLYQKKKKKNPVHAMNKLILCVTKTNHSAHKSDCGWEKRDSGLISFPPAFIIGSKIRSAVWIIVADCYIFTIGALTKQQNSLMIFSRFSVTLLSHKLPSASPSICTRDKIFANK